MAETNCSTTWVDKEVKVLLTIWGDSKIQEELDGAVSNKVVFEQIAKKLKEQGGTWAWLEAVFSKSKKLENKIQGD